MADKSKKRELGRPDPVEALDQLERPTIKWKVILQVVAVFALIWLAVGMTWQWTHWWGVGVAGVLTLVALGFGVYVWRLTRKSAAIVDILKGATDAEGRKQAIEQLEARKGAGKDALNALARSQLVAQDDPAEAMAILEGIDLDKAPAVVQDDVRANLALLYLLHGRVKDARPLADEIRLDRQPQPKAKAMYAAVVAETHARTGKAQDAKDLLEDYDPADPAYGEVAAVLLRARCYTYVATKNRGLAKTAMEQLAAVDGRMVQAFTQKGTPPELRKMAMQILGRAGALPKPKVRMKMR